MLRYFCVIVLIAFAFNMEPASAQADNYADYPMTGIQGAPDAIKEAEAMVEAMGGMEIWSQLRSVHFVHTWNIVNRVDRYLENEILDFTGPRSWVTMESEIYSRLRAYSPEYRYWNVINGEFAYASDQSLQNALERAPYSLYRLANAVARGNSYYAVRFGTHQESGVRQLEFLGPDGEVHGAIVLNANKEPVVWSTTQYSYAMGPLERYGNLWVPRWANTNNGLVSYEMVSLTGSNQPPDLSIFEPPMQDR